jgi:hypothetical protein
VGTDIRSRALEVRPGEDGEGTAGCELARIGPADSYKGTAMNQSVTGIVSGLFVAPADRTVIAPLTLVPCGCGTCFRFTEIVTRAGVVPDVAESPSHAWLLEALQCTDLTELVMRTRSERKTQFRTVAGR